MAYANCQNVRIFTDLETFDTVALRNGQEMVRVDPISRNIQNGNLNANFYGDTFTCALDITHDVRIGLQGMGLALTPRVKRLVQGWFDATSAFFPTYHVSTVLTNLVALTVQKAGETCDVSVLTGTW